MSFLEPATGYAVPTTYSRAALRLKSFAGVSFALILAEMALRPLRSPDAVAAGPRVVRQYGEGIATAHFAPDGARETGNRPLHHAAEGIILGDSHVEALQVSDRATMGSVLERIARAAGEPLNIRQYGWVGVAAPMYVAVADALLRRSSPKWIVIVLTNNDLGEEPVQTALHWRMSIGPGYSIRLINVNVAPPPAHGLRLLLRRHGLTPSAIEALATSHSALASAIVQRWKEIRGSGTGDFVVARPLSQTRPSLIDSVARASVHALSRAFGSRLVILYAPDISVTGDPRFDFAEQSLFRSCAIERAHCVSTGPAFLRERDRFGRMPRGFINTMPGEGHLNETGHRIAAEVLWDFLNSVRSG